MYSTRASRHINAPRPTVYQALLDAGAIAKWRVPEGMSSRVHEFDAREGGSFRISLSYDAPTEAGKSAPHTDTYHGRFLKLVPDQQVVEVFEFETADPELRGQMTMTTTLNDAADGPMSSSCTKASPTRCLPPTTRPARGWHWQASPRSSRQPRRRASMAHRC